MKGVELMTSGCSVDNRSAKEAPHTHHNKTHTATHLWSVSVGSCRGFHRRAPSLLCSLGPSADTETSCQHETHSAVMRHERTSYQPPCFLPLKHNVYDY